MKLYIASAFSEGMLTQHGKRSDRLLHHSPCDVAYARWLVREAGSVVSCVEHMDTAVALGAILDHDVACNREPIDLRRNDAVLLGQIVGGRLPEGATELPEGVSIQWRLSTDHTVEQEWPGHEAWAVYKKFACDTPAREWIQRVDLLSQGHGWTGGGRAGNALWRRAVEDLVSKDRVPAIFAKHGAPELRVVADQIGAEGAD